MSETVNSMRKQGYALIKKNELLVDENKDLKIANKSLESRITQLEHLLTSMQSEHNVYRDQYISSMAYSKKQGELLQERIDSLERYKKEREGIDRDRGEGNVDEGIINKRVRDKMMEVLEEENERLKTQVYNMEREREEYVKTFSMIEPVIDTQGINQPQYLSNRQILVNSQILRNKEHLLFSDGINPPPSSSPNPFNEYKDNHPLGESVVIQRQAGGIDNKDGKYSPNRSSKKNNDKRISVNDKLERTRSYGCVLI